MRKIVKMLLGVIIFMITVGLVIPLISTGMAKVIFPFQAEGSLILDKDQIRGSYLLGQQFSKQDQLWGRPAAHDYQLGMSGSSNLSVASESYKLVMMERIAFIRENHPSMMSRKVPIDLVTESASGLDPHISMDAALYQMDRLVEHTKLDAEVIKDIIKQCTEHELVNVVEVNLLLSRL